ncbi:MAG: stage III sporulation protein AB, partial [Oscillospiraceae bacterium]
EDVTTMKLFFEGLGKSDVEGQLKHCELYEKRIGDCIADAAEQHTKKGQLYKTLSLISAAAIAVLLI